MIKAVKALKEIFGFIVQAFNILMSFFSTIGMVFQYLLSIVNLAFNVVLSFPIWLRAFMMITISISIAYFLINRQAGRSD